MKKLSELYEGYPDVEILDIKMNSKEVVPGDLFVCTMGITADRHDFASAAVKAGAVAVVASRKIDVDVPVVYVQDTNKELTKLCQKFYDYPDKKLDIIAVTGTNGKTTTATIIQDLIGNDICAYQGTNGIICSKFSESIVNTTPDSDRLYKYFDRFVKAGCSKLSIEISSEAFFRHRVDDLRFKVGILTNVTQDHLNVHKTVENYVECKKTLFRQVLDDGYSILNIDDKHYEEFLSVAKGTVLTYGKSSSTLQIISINESIDHTDIEVKYNDKIFSFSSPLLGEFNVYNLCAGILALIALDYKIEYIIPRVKNIKVPNGRCQFLKFGQNYNIVLDYAHTPDAFLKIYDLLNKIKKKRIITVTGSAGGREHEKRPEMGKIVLDNSDFVIFTMDDPRNEDPNLIIDDLVSNSNKNNYERIIDRKEAIYKAFNMAEEDDIVLVAGKGTDNYMAVGGEYLEYCDLEVINDYFKK